MPLTKMKSTVHKFEDEKHPCKSIFNALKNVTLCHQEGEMNNMDCLENFANKVAVHENCGDNIDKDESPLKSDEQGQELIVDSQTVIQWVMDHRTLILEIGERTRETFSTLAFAKGVDKVRHVKLLEELENNHTTAQQNNCYWGASQCTEFYVFHANNLSQNRFQRF